ncbi:MAG: helix-hairpin-helix domain-containing protein [Planctomycetaceae bacterium]|nr:helix-hairpin-helix domain-containing protein [Planctomycetaceae bacterium]
MIASIEGELLSAEDGVALLQVGALAYEVLVPAADVTALAGQRGATVRFVTLHYLEGQGQGSSFWPRLIGFRSAEDRDFFELFTTVKGIGNRKALRALQRPFAEVAAAIARRDEKALTGLPEIGKKMAETIVVELKDKVARFTAMASGGMQPVVEASAASLVGAAGDAVVVLVQLGESRVLAERMVERALQVEGAKAAAEVLVATALRLRGSV